jgi:hypothetical protein
MEDVRKCIKNGSTFLLFTGHCYNKEIKDHEIGATCSMNWWE